MTRTYQIKNDGNIVSRLRLSLAVVVLTLCVSALVSGYLIVGLKDSQRSAIENSIPTLTNSHELASQLVSIADLTVRMENVSNAYVVKAIEEELNSRKNQLRLTLENNLLTTEQQATNVELLRSSAEYLEDSLQNIVNSKLKMIALEESIATKLTLVNAVRVSFNDLIEPLSLELATNLNESLEYIGKAPTVINLTNYNLAGNVNDQYQLLEFSFGLSALLDIIESVSTAYNDQNQAEIATGVKIRFKSITQILVNFDDVEKRRALASMIKGLRDLTLSEGGILDDISEYNRNSTIFTTTHHEQLNQIKTFSQIIDRVVSDTRTDIQASIVDFNKILRNIVFALVLFGCGSTAIIALVNFIVVERQINRRMQKLTAAVSDIASGNIEREVDVSGEDELGTMATALEVFKENAVELQRSNKELEQFAYAASHDLRSPLRAIESLASWTLEDAADDLTPECKSNLEQLLVRANRLSKLQTDLLDYSKAGKPDDSNGSADFTHMVERLAEMLDADKQFTIRIVSAPDGLATPVVPLRQILMNLITNAMKHHDRDSGIIEITVGIENNRLRIAVSDDGPGIAAEYQERIFGLFEKLESRDKVEGSGLGLSLVKKMVERFKGSISVESDPTKQRGSTFIFDWPYTEAIADSLVLEAPSFEEPQKRAVGF